MAAATLPAAIALITVAGPVTQSPPANIPLCSLISLVASASIVPRLTVTPCSSKYLVSIPCPIATTIKSQGIRTSSFAAVLGDGLPPLILLIICGCTQRPTTLSFLSFSILTGDISSRISHPSASAPATSSSSAVISSLRLLYTMLTFSAPSLTDERATSIATLPPPITTTFFPV